MRDFFSEYSKVLTVIVVTVAIIAIAMGLKVVLGDSVLGISNKLDNKATSTINYEMNKATVKLPEIGSVIEIEGKKFRVISLDGGTAELLALD